MNPNDQLIKEVSSFCAIPEKEAEKLLSHFGWDSEIAITTFLENPSIISSITSQQSSDSLSIRNSPEHPHSQNSSLNSSSSFPIHGEPSDLHTLIIHDIPKPLKPKAWGNKKLDLLFAPPPNFRSSLSIFSFLREAQSSYSKCFKLEKSLNQAKRSKSFPPLIFPIIFFADQGDFATYAIYRDVFKKKQILNLIKPNFFINEIDSSDEVSKDFIRKYGLKDNSCLLFLHPFTWELIEIINKKDFENLSVVSNVLENVKGYLEKEKELSLNKTEELNNLNNLNISKNNLNKNLNKKDKIRFKIFSSLKEPFEVWVDEKGNVEDLIEAVKLEIGGNGNLGELKVKRRGPYIDYLDGDTKLEELRKVKDLVVVQINN